MACIRAASFAASAMRSSCRSLAFLFNRRSYRFLDSSFTGFAARFVPPSAAAAGTTAAAAEAEASGFSIGA